MMLTLVAVALVFSGGMWLVFSALWPPRPSLAAALDQLHTPGAPRTVFTPTTVADRSLTVRAGRAVLTRLHGAGLTGADTLRNVEVLHRPLEIHAGVCVLGALAGGAAGPVAWTAVAVSGTELPLIVPVWLSLLGAAAGFVAPTVVLRAEAAKARSDFRHALGAYLDVLVLLLAANEGPEGAMETAARAGNGPAFMELRRATVQARLSGDAVWDTLDALGTRIGVAELREVAAAGSLAGERGAAVRKSLIAKARSLRAATLAEAETNARSRSQAMFAPIVVMGFGFILFLLYPLVSNIRLGA